MEICLQETKSLTNSMRVWNNSFYADDLREKVIYTGPIVVTALTNYFRDRSYGDSVNEILYVEVCEQPKYKENFQELLSYYPRTKKIEVSVELTFEVALELDNKSFLRYLAQCYMARTSDIETLNIKGFDLMSYMRDLEIFFKQNDSA